MEPADPASRRLTEAGDTRAAQEFIERSKLGDKAHPKSRMRKPLEAARLGRSASTADAKLLVTRAFTECYNDLQSFTKKAFP